MEIIPIFLVTLLIIGGLGLAIFFGKPPVHRPSRQEILSLLRGVEAGTTRQEAWDLFIGYPLAYDPELEAVRQQCVVLEEGDGDIPPAGQGLGEFIYNRDGRERISQIADALEKLIKDAPVYRDF
ncbi:MAG: hypothetical protein OIF57_03195 [Marinobacterium sp.]|nr:hypothetical protein [Marinobacterium sp.]